MDVMSASDPAYRALHKPTENGGFEDEDDEEFYAEFGSATKKRRSSRSVKERKSAGNSFLKDLLSIERLSDSCIPQLLKTSFTTFLEDNVQHLQLKAISLISGIFYAYPQHRTYVMDKALQVLLKLPLSKRVPRTFHLPDEEQRQIQMITVLLIQLVHCSANLPESVRQVSNGSPISELPIDPSDPAKCHEAITDACCLFWNRVLHCLTSTKAQDVSELKAIIENLVTDLLTTLNLPEFPASAPILEVLCVLLLQNAGLKSKDIAARSMAIDLLGTIAARLKHDALLCRTEKFWVVQELMGRDDVDSKYPKDACSLCLDARNEKPLFVCQSCQRLFHVDCMGVREHEVPTNSSFCQFCLCRKELLVLESYCKPQAKDEATKDHGPVGKSSDASARIKKMEMVQQMLLNYLQDSGNADDMHLFICWFYLCLWYKDDTDPQRKFLCNLARLNSKATARDSGGASSLLTRGSVKKISLALGQNNSFSGGFDKILHVLLACLRQNSPVIRAKALRAVSIIVEADPEVLCDKHVQAAVEGRFLDSAISVREAALELVGRHIASHPDYFEKVAGRINDTGVSVQKRSIKIIRDMCTSNTNFSKFTNACTRIISRISDEESSIRDLVCKIFYEFWFKEPSDSRSNIFGDGSSVSLEVTKKTEQIVEMLQSMPSHQPLVTVIKCNLSLDFFPQSAKAVGINPMSLAAVRKRCELMCKCLLERILQVKEMDKEAEVCTFPYVLLLHAFCVVDPTFCAPASDPSQFVVTLQPYLKSQADNQVVVRLLESIIFVIDSVLLLRKLPQSVVEELEHELTQMIVRHSFLTVVHACIRCLCSVSKVACKGATVIEFLIQAFFNRLDALGLDNKKQVGRSLVCLGLLIRYGNSLLSASLSSRNIDVVRSLDLFKKYLQAEDFAIKVRSLQALGYVLIARPEFMLERGVGRILEATLSSSTDVRLKMQALQNMYEYLLDAESQLGIDDVGNNTVTSSTDGGLSVPVAASAGDTNICGGIIQLYWDSVLERCLDANDQVRQSALKIVKFVLHQGLVHPITCVPHLIALETDPLEANSDLAHYLLMNMNEKYPAFFESRLGDGLQLSFIFMQSMSRSSAENLNQKVQSKVPGSMKGKAVSASFANARFGVSRIYKLIHGNRISRNKFMSSVVRKFDMPSWNNSVISFLMYCAEILALLPFTLPDEPLYLIYAINRVIQVRAGGLEANMKSFLHLLHGDDGQKIHGNGTVHQDESVRSLSYDPTMCVDANEGVQLESADHQVPNDTAFMDLNSRPIILDSSCGISEVEIQKIQADCLGAAALQLLLKLKRHLKIVYSLDDARCQAFSPNDVLKPGRTLSQQNIPFNLSEIRIDLPTTYPDLLQRYQEFKNALRDDTVDYSTYIANIKRKRPPPSRRGGKAAVHVVAAGGDEHDEDDDDDEDWGGSAGRKLNNGGRKSGSRSRQRW